MNAVCLVLDRLHVGYLGAYGNSWIETPQLDRLAAESFVFDQALIDSPRLEMLYRSYWHGWHALCPHEPPEDRPTLPRLLSNQGVRTTLLTDEPAVAGHALARQFDERIQMGGPERTEPAEEIGGTHLARCFAQLIDWLPAAREPFLLWCHLTALGSVWDAPLEYRARYVEQGDPEPIDSAAVPCRMLNKDYDPDLVLGILQAYAGQVSLLDGCLGALLDFLNESRGEEETLLVLASARGFPLGEHRRIGPCDDALYGPLVQVPMMIRFPDALGATARSQALVEPADLWATLLQWYRIDQRPESPTGRDLLPLVREEVELVRDRLCIKGDTGQRGMRTAAWYLRSGAEVELFAKPDDRWEANNGASRCPNMVDSLRNALEQYCQALYSGHIGDLAPLDENVIA